jgi:hypothetical protein
MTRLSASVAGNPSSSSDLGPSRPAGTAILRRREV